MSSTATKRIVLKFGTGILTKLNSPEPDPVQLRKLVEAMALMKAAGHSVVVVSSARIVVVITPINPVVVVVLPTSTHPTGHDSHA